MKEKNVKEFYLKNIAWFLIFGLIISILTTYINYVFKYDEIKEKIDRESIFYSKNIEENVSSYLYNVQDSIDSLATNELFLNYLINPSKNTEYISQQLFVNTMKNHHNFFQVRFLDKNGMEKIRVDKSSNSNDILIIDNSKLQDKSDRYYFKETVQKNINDFWYSKIDLNVENNEIEKPIKPTIRVTKNIFYKGEFFGIIIVNVDMKKILNRISKNAKFDIFLIDKDGYFLINPDNQKSWSRYLNSQYTLNNELPNIRQDEDSYFFSLEKYFHNNENIELILRLKKDYYDLLFKNNVEIIFTIALIVIVLSSIISIFISYPTSKVYIEFNKLFKESMTYLSIIDKYVISLKCNTEGKCIEISQRFTEISEYSREDIIGKKPSILQSGNTSKEIYQDLWNTITKGLTWTGELENKTKSGESYWVEMTIIPEIIDNKIISYTSISRNITEKKLIEKISETDKLTQINNRLKLDKGLESAINNYNRYKQVFSVMLIDIDYFKKVNDVHGHLVGDTVLVEISNLLKTHVRATDILGRWGGEEFMIICSNTDINGTKHFAENLRKIVEEFEFSVVKQKTISIGVTEINNSDNIETLLKRVDDNLYKSKLNGRNRVTS